MNDETDPTTALLIRARGFIERGWCADGGAKDAEGRHIDPISERAVAWCAAGAVVAAGVSATNALWIHPAMQRLGQALGDDIVDFNYRQETVEPVLAA